MIFKLGVLSFHRGSHDRQVVAEAQACLPDDHYIIVALLGSLKLYNHTDLIGTRLLSAHVLNK